MRLGEASHPGPHDRDTARDDLLANRLRANEAGDAAAGSQQKTSRLQTPQHNMHHSLQRAPQQGAPHLDTLELFFF